MKRVSTELLLDLARLDTPTVCNALEVVAPERRGRGFTVEPLFCLRPELGSMVGYALTARIRAQHPSEHPEAVRERSLGYYEFVATGPKPGIVVIQDLDGDSRGFGAFWGEVNSNVHQGLGCLGVITDGSIRDLDDVAKGFQMLAGSVGPSHAHVRVVDYGGPVAVAGMSVRTGELIHADRHGAVVIPESVASRIPEAAAGVARRERVVIEAAQRPDFDLDQLRGAWKKASELH